MPPSHPSDASMKVTPTPKPVPPREHVLTDIHTVVELTDLTVNGTQPARLSNLTHSNINATTNRGAQNAVANQQAHTMLGVSIVGKAANKVQNLGPLEARSSVDVLTSNEIATTLMSLKGALQAFSGGGSGGGGGGGRHPFTPGYWTALRAMLRRLLEQVQRINTTNAQLQGDGSLATPYGTEHRLYVASGVTLGFPGYQPSQINIEMLRKLLVGR